MLRNPDDIGTYFVLTIHIVKLHSMAAKLGSRTMSLYRPADFRPSMSTQTMTELQLACVNVLADC